MNARDAVKECNLVLKGARCSCLLIYLLEALLYLMGKLFVVTPIVARAQFLIADVLQLMLSKVSRNSSPLTDQLLAILAQSVFSLKSLKPVVGTEEEFTRFTKLASINASKRLLLLKCFQELHVVCCSDYVRCLVDVVFHYCCHVQVAKRKGAHSSVLQCLAVFGDEDILEHFYLQDWD